MSNAKITAELLESAGWSEPQIDRYYKLLRRKQQFGLSALSVSDRKFYNSALPACNKAQAKRDAAIRNGQTRRLAGQKPLEEKTHYRWIELEASLYARLADLIPGEEVAGAILKTEYLRALQIYQPVLDTLDTAHRGKFDNTEKELYELAASVGRQLSYDGNAHFASLRAEFAEQWNNRWDANPWVCGGAIALTGEDALAFRSECRVVLESFVRTFPSVRQTVGV